LTDSPFYTAYQEAALYIEMKRYETADSILDSMLGREDVDIALRKGIAEKYYEMGRIHKAIEILSDCLKQDPASSDIPELIKRYQEEL
jgi:predicted Zn-dependent protease